MRVALIGGVLRFNLHRTVRWSRLPCAARRGVHNLTMREGVLDPRPRGAGERIGALELVVTLPLSVRRAGGRAHRQWGAAL